MLVLSDGGSNLGGIQRSDLVGDHSGSFDVKVHIVNPELFVKPLDLLINDDFGQPASSLDDLLDYSEAG